MAAVTFNAGAWNERLMGPGADDALNGLKKRSNASSGCCPVQWKRDEIAFRCEECEMDSNCVVCPPCFFMADHTGHKGVRLVRTSGGCCDCGDPCSWSPKGFCPLHRGITDVEDSEDALLELPSHVRDTCLQVMEEAVGHADGLLARLEGGNLTDRQKSHVRQALVDNLAWLQSLGDVSLGLRYALRIALEPRITSWLKRAVWGRIHDAAEEAAAFSLEGPSPAAAAERKKLKLEQLFHDFFLAVIQQSPKLKFAFSVVCVEQYAHLPDELDESDDNAEEGVQLRGMTVQLFTISEVAIALCRQHDMVPRICNFLARTLENVSLGERESLIDTAGTAMFDLRYALQHEAVCNFVLEHPPSRAAVARLLAQLWRANPQHRETTVHVLMESEAWRWHVQFEYYIAEAIRPLENAARAAAWADAVPWYTELLSALRDAVGRQGTGRSFHVRLLRFFVRSLPYSALLASLREGNSAVQGAAAAELLGDQPTLAVWLALFPVPDLALMLREAVQPYLFWAEVKAGLWVRNGESMRYQADKYADWHQDDVLAVQLALVLLGAHHMRGDVAMTDTAEELREPVGMLLVQLLGCHMPAQAEGRGRRDARTLWASVLAAASAPDDMRTVCVEAFWELLGRTGNEAWLPDDCEHRKGSATEAGEAARSILRRFLVHALAARAASASEIESELPADWQDHPARDDVLREISTSKVSDDGITKFELKADSWRFFDHFFFLWRSRPSPEADENAVKHKADLLGMSHELPSCQTWRDAVLQAWQWSALMPMVRDFLRARCLAQSQDGPVPYAGVLPWALKVLDLMRQGRCLTADEPAAVTRQGALPADVSLGSPVLLNPAAGVPQELQGLEGVVIAKADESAVVLAPGLGEVQVAWASCAPLSGCARMWDDCLHAVKGLKEVGTLAHLCSRLALRLAAQTGGGCSAAGEAAADADSAKAARKRQLAARQKAMLQSMATRQKCFMMDAAAEDDAEEEVKEGIVLQCDVCREPAAAGRPVCMLAHAVPTNSLQRLARHPSFGEKSLAVSSCGHLMHRDCFHRHKEHYRHSLHDIFSLSRPGQGCVPCPMCRSIISVALPVLPAGPAFSSSDTRAAGSDGGASISDDEMSASLQQLVCDGRDSTAVLLEACALNILVTSVTLPGRAMETGTPPLHAVLLRFLAHAQQPSEVDLAASIAADVDPKLLLLQSLGRACQESPAAFRSVATTLTDFRAQQLLGAEEDLANGLAAWLVFVAWVASGVWPFEARALNVLAHLPSDPAERVRELSQLVLEAPLDLAAAAGQAALSTASVQDEGGYVQFAALPSRMLDLIQDVYNKPCVACKSVPKEPCVCLVCGAVVCVGRSCAAAGQSGGCALHARTCGMSQGFFLAPYWGRIVATSGTMLGLLDCPYVDSYGEPVPPTAAAGELRLDARRLERLRAAISTGTVGLEILRLNQRTGRYMPEPL